jgi:periplasmic divalent cation tolerance protein
MTDKIIVFVTCESQEQAENIAQTLVTEKLAACVNILPKMWSCYMWKEELTWAEEFQLLIKTTQGRFGQVQERIGAIHSYEVPEIVSVVIEDASQQYLDWIDTSVGG